ncbi:hypothetical protein [Thermococcus sp.]
MKFKWILISLFFIFILISNTYVSCASAYYEGVVIFPRLSVVGRDDAFILVAVYKLSLPPNMNSSAITLPIEDKVSPDYEYLFYVNSSGAYLVYKAMLPYNSPPAQVFPIVGYYNNSWYLLLDHSAVTFNVSPRRAIGLYRFNKSCISPTTLLLYNVTSMVDTQAFPTEYGEYMEFAPTQKSSVGFYFTVPKSVLDKYFGPNTTATDVTARSLVGGETLVILPVEGAFKNAESSKYILIKPTKMNLATLRYYYSVVATPISEDGLPYYGVLFYSKNGSIRFVPLIKYALTTTLTHPWVVGLAPNVKLFHVPFCPESEENNSIRTPVSYSSSFSVSNYWCVLIFFLGVLTGIIVGRRR